MSDMKTKAEKLVDVFYSTFADERVDFIIQDLNNNAIANVLRALTEYSVMFYDPDEYADAVRVDDILKIADELEQI